MNIFLDPIGFLKLFNIYLALVHTFLKGVVAIAIVWLLPMRQHG